MTTRSPIAGTGTVRGASASGSPGAGVKMSPDSQHGPTKTTGAAERSARTSIGCCAPYNDGRVISVMPVFNLYNSEWPVHTQQINLPPAKFVHDGEGNQGRTTDSIVSLGTVVSGGIVERSVLSPNVRVHSRALVTDSILLDGVQIGRDCTVRKAILDKSVVVADGASIGVDKQRDLDRGFFVTDSGITVVGKGVLVTP